MVGRLTGKTAPEENMQGQKHQPKSQILLNDVLTTTSEIQDGLLALKGLDDSELDKMPQKFFTQTSNRRLRGSRPGLNSKLFENFYSASKEVPQSSKYPREVDLGPKWKKPLLYPRNCKKKTTVEWSDMERLNEGEYLNDNLISFYLRYLEHQLELERPDLAKKVYFFNTFFFASLTNTQKKQQTINYEAVQKWTRLIDIFAYDYVVVPINESAHWYVAIICNLSALIPNPEFSENLSRNESTSCLNQKEISDDVDDVNEVREERPTLVFGASERENISLVVENCNFQDPTLSFAEMTLDTAPKECSTPKDKPPNIESVTTTPKSNDTDQGMLDAQIEGDMAGSTKPQSSELFSNVCDVEKVIESEHIGPLVDENQFIASKKRKRKSIPPIARHDPNTPTIITFDSLGIPHTGTSRALREYLRQEGNAKREMNWEELPIKGITAKEIPQQNNCCDCGLFLLGYIDKFLDDPKDFISSIVKREYNIEKDWPRLNPSDLRASIRKQIQELHAVQEEEHKDISKKMKKTQGRMGNVEARLLPDSAPLEIRKEPKEPFSLVSTSTEIPPTKLKPTRAEALKSALAIDEDEPRISEGFVSKNPVVAAVVIQTTNDVHKLEPVLGQDESVVVIADSQSDEVTSKPTNPSSSLGHKQESLPEAEISTQGQSAPETKLLKSVELPSEIQDSQPGSFHQSPHEETLQTRTGNISPKIEDPLPLPRTWSPQRGKHLEGSRRRKSSTPLRSPRAKQRESSIIEID